jgi:dipeptidyl aminopeptidase/acylaminoacyl peptidase
MKSSIRLAFVLVSVLLSTVVFAQQPSPRPITIEDSLKFREVHDPQLSPDAKWLAYTVSTPKLKDDSNKERIWMVPISASGTPGADPIALTSEDESSTHPRWSPDGKYIAFLSGRDDEKTQIWLLNRLGGEAEKLTDTAQDVDEFYWSPDGQRLALILRDPSP